MADICVTMISVFPFLIVASLVVQVLGFVPTISLTRHMPYQRDGALLRIGMEDRQFGVRVMSRPRQYSSALHLFGSGGNNDDEETEVNDDDEPPASGNYNHGTQRARIRQKIGQLAQTIVVRPIASAAPMPRAIASILKDVTVDLFLEQVSSLRNGREGDATDPQDKSSEEELVEDIFVPLRSSHKEIFDVLCQARDAQLMGTDSQASLKLIELALDRARQHEVLLCEAKEHSRQAIEAVEVAALAREEKVVEEVTQHRAILPPDVDGAEVDVSTLTYDDVGYHQAEMAAPFLDEDQCLIPGEAVVRVEKAPENSRRIFAGIDIPCSVDKVWNLLTDYDNLQNVVPNLKVNEVLERFDSNPQPDSAAGGRSDVDLCRGMSQNLKGSLLKQVGGAKVIGVNFSARTTLEVREWPNGMPDFAHFQDQVYDGMSRDERARANAKVKLERYRFPRPFALSKLPTRDISMQSIENDTGEFRMYQGVWRMQPLPGCAPDGQEAMRLTYAVEVSPRPYLPVSLVEGRIVRDLCTNLAAIRDFVTVDERIPVPAYK